ncbi:MAG: M20/M25/M40 family metallo-hydrolase [Sphingobacteriales bacterium]|nr:MAG: M20/M25/M40 family metallo-hydrolase [Sphingobacteriales bacterium]
MRKLLLLGLLLSITSFLFSQRITKVINVKKVQKIEQVLSADDMEGRKAFTPGAERAASFIANEFKKAGLQKYNGSNSFLQEFAMIQPKFISATATVDGVDFPAEKIFVVTTQAQLTVTNLSGYGKVSVKKENNLTAVARELIGRNENLIVTVDTSLAANFSKLSFLKRNLFSTDKSVIFLLTTKEPTTFSIEVKHEIKEAKLMNVAGILPGKSLKNEYVIFSAHYDHLGVGKPNAKQDSIFNGANDDAAGTTAVIMLARYFARQKNNERTLVFAAFTAEESGGYGATYFSKQFDPAKVMAMFNIEMIGTESKWGTNSAYITGYEKTNMGEILQKNLNGTPFTFHPDPYPEQKLFYRSDNATLARLGVPAHTISTSKMDSEKYYHTQEDEIETLDMKNMTEIIKAIALSSRSIISGRDTPTRVVTDKLESK